MLAHIGSVLGFEVLVLAVDAFFHALEQNAARVTGNQRIPLAAPQHFDDVPARAAKNALEFLNDLSVAANRPVEALQIAVDDEDQIVELLAAGERNGTE